MQNAGMEFDSATWTPLYRLVMGEPGQSHALETARRYGLPESVLQPPVNCWGMLVPPLPGSLMNCGRNGTHWLMS
jgi:hypothetical protein